MKLVCISIVIFSKGKQILAFNSECIRLFAHRNDSPHNVIILGQDRWNKMEVLNKSWIGLTTTKPFVDYEVRLFARTKHGDVSDFSVLKIPHRFYGWQIIYFFVL